MSALLLVLDLVQLFAIGLLLLLVIALLHEGVRDVRPEALRQVRADVDLQLLDTDAPSWCEVRKD